MIRSTWTVETRWRDPQRFVCVTDLDEGMSVTNDIERVIDDLTRAGTLQSGDRLIYRDTMGIWDEALLDARCRFVDFRSLNARSCGDAITRALGQHKERAMTFNELHELRELYALVQVLKSAITPPPAEPVQTLTPLIAAIDTRLSALLNAAEKANHDSA